MDVSLEKMILWIMDWFLASSLKLKPLNDGFVSYKHAAFVFRRC